MSIFTPPARFLHWGKGKIREEKEEKHLKNVVQKTNFYPIIMNEQQQVT
jgi:hypothetical protein